MAFSSCQSAFRIAPESLPRTLATAEPIKLTSADGTVYNLGDITSEHNGTVAIFWQIDCPCVKRYQERINHLYDAFGSKGLAFMHVSSNTNESFDEVKLEYTERAIPLPLLRDEGGVLAKALGVKGTPTAVVFNPTGEVVYMGWIDNERDEKERGRIPYLENALLELINNKAITTNTSPMFGCSIR